MPEEKDKATLNTFDKQEKPSKEKEIESIVKNAQDKTDSSTSQKEGSVYSRANGEPLVDPLAIKSCKNEQNRDIIENGRLGSYDEYGNYLFIPEIRQELESIPKLIYNTSVADGKTTYDMRAIIPIFGDIFFKLRINKYEAQLLLIEKVTREAGQYVEVYEELVDSLAMPENDSIPQEIIFSIFHIFEDDGDYEKEFEEYYGFENILLKKIYMGLLAKEIKQLTAQDEHECYLEMMQIIESSGEYGQRIKKEFLTRLRDRRQIFDIKDEFSYDRAINEILLSSIDIVTTKEDKENPKTREIYNRIINVRNKNLSKHIAQAESLVDENYVKNVQNRAIKSFMDKNYAREKEVQLEYFDKLTFSNKKGKKTSKEKHKLDKPLMKQLTALKQAEEQQKNLTKEEKIAQIIDKKKESGKEVKRVKSSKGQKAKAKKKTKKNSPKKKGKAKVKTKQKVKKPKNVKKAEKSNSNFSSKKVIKKKNTNNPDKKVNKKKKTLGYYKKLLALYDREISSLRTNTSLKPTPKAKPMVKKAEKVKASKRDFDNNFGISVYVKPKEMDQEKKSSNNQKIDISKKAINNDPIKRHEEPSHVETPIVNNSENHDKKDSTKLDKGDEKTSKSKVKVNEMSEKAYLEDINSPDFLSQENNNNFGIENKF